MGKRNGDSTLRRAVKADIRSRSGKLKSVDTFWQLLLVAPGDPSEKPTDSTVPRFPYSDATFPESHSK